VSWRILKIAVGKIAGLPPGDEVGVMALDPNLHQRLDQGRECNAFAGMTANVSVDSPLL
jgi:hypothetical protein